MRTKKFRLGNLFTLKGVKQAKSQKDIPTEVPGIPYVIQSQRNNMVCRTVGKEYLLSHDEPVEEGNAIVLGVTLPCVSYQKDEFGASQVITARAPFLNERIGLYVATVIEKQLYRFSYTHKPGIKVYSDLELPLPVMTVMMPDWAMLETLLKVHGGGAGMSKIDTSSWKKFKIKDLFEIRKVYGKPISEYPAGSTPYVTGAQDNNGVVGYVTVPPEAISEGGCISVDPIKGFACWQPNPFVGRGFSGASINLLYNEHLTENTALYVCSCIEKVSTAVAAYTNLFNSNRLADAEISLPVTAIEQPDWDYMQERIAELEQERIAELEQYLVATGLNDYTLTDEDLKTLSLSLVSGVTKLEICRLLLGFARK